MDLFNIYSYIYFGVISIISSVMIVFDKRRAVNKKTRVRESTLFLLALLGGSGFMYLSMCLFNHKTQKNKFVFLIPIIFILQFIIIYHFSNIILP